MTDEIPTVDARREGDLLIARCPYCHGEHVHGLGNGHVAADCPTDNPGYYVRQTPAEETP